MIGRATESVRGDPARSIPSGQQVVDLDGQPAVPLRR
jgi:hypothetical protein